MKRRIYKKWLKNPLNKRLIRKFCKPFPKEPPVAFVEKQDLAWVFEQFAKHTDILIQRKMDRLCIPKELLRPINIGASGNMISFYGAPLIENPNRVYIMNITDDEEPYKDE